MRKLLKRGYRIAMPENVAKNLSKGLKNHHLNLKRLKINKYFNFATGDADTAKPTTETGNLIQNFESKIKANKPAEYGLAVGGIGGFLLSLSKGKLGIGTLVYILIGGVGGYFVGNWIGDKKSASKTTTTTGSDIIDKILNKGKSVVNDVTGTTDQPTVPIIAVLATKPITTANADDNLWTLLQANPDFKTNRSDFDTFYAGLNDNQKAILIAMLNEYKNYDFSKMQPKQIMQIVGVDIPNKLSSTYSQDDILAVAQKLDTLFV